MMPKEILTFEFQSVAIFAFDGRCLPAYKLLIERAKRASKNTGTLTQSVVHYVPFLYLSALICRLIAKGKIMTGEISEFELK